MSAEGNKLIVRCFPEEVISIVLDPSLGSPAKYGISELSKTLENAGFNVKEGETKENTRSKKSILIGYVGSSLFNKVKSEADIKPRDGKEAYTLTKATAARDKVICIVGSDDNGVKYGCLELAEQVEYLKEGQGIFDRLASRRESPNIPIRRLYIFLHNADLERDWYYSEEFWDGYLSLLAKSRYNEFNIVFGHQTSYLIPIYPYLFDIEEYPDVYVEGLSKEERTKNLGMLQFISNLAQERGITFFIGIWQSKAWDGARVIRKQESKVHGIDDNMLRDFTRQGILKLLRLCPAIEGLQLRMNPESGLDDQSFFRDVFVEAIKNCGREVKVELRNWGLEQETLDSFLNVYPNLTVSFKYFAEHQGMPYQPVQMRFSYSYDSLLRNNRKYEVFWHLWNLGTHRLFLWGDPDYVRTFVNSCHLGDALGFEVTPPLSQKGFSQFKQIPRYWSIYKEGIEHDYYKWEYERYWFFYKLWGRLGYNPELNDDLWLKEMVKRFGEEAAPHIFRAYKESSKVISYLVSHHMDDPNMYIWLELDTGGTIDYFSGIIPGEKTLFLNARDYAKNRVKGVLSAKITPFRAAEDLASFAIRCKQALSKADKIEALKDNKEYFFTKLDMKALSTLARYNSEKIKASAYLCLFYETSDYRLLQEARKCAEEELRLWRELVNITEPYYYENLHLGPSGGHWKDNIPLVEYDLNRIDKVGEIFEKYGLFTIGFDFGSTVSGPAPRPYMREDVEYDPVEKRFIGINEENKYSKETGYGWEGNVVLSVTRKPTVDFRVLRGARFIGTERQEYEKSLISSYPDIGIPTEYLYPDFVSSKSPASFRINVPDGKYQLSFLIGDVSDSPVNHGTMDITVNSTNVISGLEIPKGEVRQVRAEVRVSSGRLRIDLRPGEWSEWLLNGLIITEMKPHIGHLPIYSALKGTDLTIGVTVTSSFPLEGVWLFYKEERVVEYQKVNMQGDRFIYSATIARAELGVEVIEYYIEAEDENGNLSYFPEGGKERPISLKLAEDLKAPKVVEHKKVTAHNSSKPLTLSLKVDDDLDLADVWLHYRTVDQNADFKVISMEKEDDKKYSGTIPASDFDPIFDEMYYFELVDKFGNGSFYPDPFTGGRYYVIKITK